VVCSCFGLFNKLLKGRVLGFIWPSLSCFAVAAVYYATFFSKGLLAFVFHPLFPLAFAYTLCWFFQLELLVEFFMIVSRLATVSYAGHRSSM